MSDKLGRLHNEPVFFSGSIQDAEMPSQQEEEIVLAKVDEFEKKSSHKKSVFHRSHHISEKHAKYLEIIQQAKDLWGSPLKEEKLPYPDWEAIYEEEQFIEHPTIDGFYTINEEFNRTMLITGHQKFAWLDEICIQKNKWSHALIDNDDVSPIDKEIKLEEWHKKHRKHHLTQELKAHKRTEKRNKKLETHHLGFGGKMTKVIGESKAASFFAKNNLTMRGNIFKLTHITCPKNIYEIMPRYGYRKKAHVAVRVSQFGISGILTIVGYAMIPVTFGISKIATDHARTLITLSGEAITHKIAGATEKKVTVHCGLRGVQLEIPRAIPIAGDIINISESVALGTAAIGIVSTTLADLVLQKTSTRYASTINIDDLGDSRCLEELDRRIDYLSQFLLPYGQYLLLKETNLDERQKLKLILKEHFKTLRDLEKKKVESLNYYRLALVANKIPLSHRDKIFMDCVKASPLTHINTHRIARQCLNTLIEQDPALRFLAKKEHRKSVLLQKIVV